MTLTGDKRISYCIFGSIAALGFAPFNLFPIFILSFAWFFIQLSRQNNFWNSFLFFIALHIASLYWLVYPLTFDLKHHWILIPFALIAIPAYFSLWLSCAIAFVKFFSNIFSKALIFSVAICAATYLYGHGSLGFPWVLPAYIWNIHEVFMQTLSIFGPYGLGLITLLISAFIGIVIKLDYKFCNGKIAFYFAIAILAFVVIFGFVNLCLHKTDYLRESKACIVQGNIYQKDTQEMSSENKLKTYFDWSGDWDYDFIIWPEASIPFLYKENDSRLQKRFAEVMHKGSYLITGAVREDLQSHKIYNSVIFVNSDGENVANYDKIQLVPFGEYVPFRSILPEAFQAIASDIGDFDIGENRKVINVSGLKVAASVCFEAAFPNDFLPKEDDIDVIINVTNDTWFGFTSQIYQHLQIVRARAIETGLPLLRAANFGISAVFDPQGREVKHIKADCVGFISFNIPKKLDYITLYRKYGDNIFFFMEFIAILMAIFIELRSKQRSSKKSVGSVS